MTAPSQPIRRPPRLGSLLERLAVAGHAGRRRADPVRVPDGRPAGRYTSGVRRRPPPRGPGGDRDSRPRGARAAADRRRHRCWRGVHGRPLVQPRPCGPAAARGAEPRGAGTVGRLVPRPAPASPHARPPGASKHATGRPSEHRGPLRPRQRLLPAVPRRDDDVFERSLRSPDQSLADAQRNKYRGSRREPGCPPASTSWRSGAAGVALGCTRPESSAAA